MSTTTKVLIDAVQAAAVETAAYTSPANGRGTAIDKFTGTNTTGSAAVLSVRLVKAGGAAGAANTITSAKSLAAGEAYGFPELVGHFLAAGDFLSILAGTGAAITVRASGREFT